MDCLGAHLSAAGGVWRAVEVAAAATCEAVQLFLRPPGRWAAPQSPPDEVARFQAATRANHVDGRCYAHAPYLLNLASADEDLREHSRRVLVEELLRAGRLGLAGVVLHPGSAGIGGDRWAAEGRCREALASALSEAGDTAARLLVEGAAGAGGQVGTSPSELARLVAACSRRRVGLCLDLAHLWAAGYDLREGGLDRILDEVGASWEQPGPDLWHGNDTPSELGSSRDRHAPPGEGQLGEAFFRRFLADERAMRSPVILEIPPGDDNELVRDALARLRSWRLARPAG
ncbi:MAG TPA: deoxyribonuclease IV [Thermoanaerobaculaceae bacterium]|nr:deoxyribonuclease IV [Thermoanaerobaculaceae bacterium]HPS77560.1 deoxyribonuclease IV [Thermoanaerobaculaceae bacterium]